VNEPFITPYPRSDCLVGSQRERCSVASRSQSLFVGASLRRRRAYRDGRQALMAHDATDLSIEILLEDICIKRSEEAYGNDVTASAILDRRKVQNGDALALFQ
jgi:hypothetical protein